MGNSYDTSPAYGSILKVKVKVTPEGQRTTYSSETSSEPQNCSRVLLSLSDHILNLRKSEGWGQSSAQIYLQNSASSSEQAPCGKKNTESLIEDKHPKFVLKEKERRGILQRLELMWDKVGFSSLWVINFILLPLFSY